MKIITSIIILAIFGTFFTPLLSHAQTNIDLKDPLGIITQPGYVPDASEGGGLRTIMMAVLKYVLGITMTLAVLGIIIVGFRYFAAMGNPQQMEAAKKQFAYIIIGFVMVVLAFVILGVITTVIVELNK